MRNKTQKIIEFEEFVIVVIFDTVNYDSQSFLTVGPAQQKIARIIDRYANKGGKPVYGLFVSDRLDANSILMFQRRFWYRPDYSGIPLTAIPLTRVQYESFSKFFAQPQLNAALIRDKLSSCLQSKQLDTLLWKKEIDRIMQ